MGFGYLEYSVECSERCEIKICVLESVDKKNRLRRDDLFTIGGEVLEHKVFSCFRHWDNLAGFLMILSTIPAQLCTLRPFARVKKTGWSFLQFQ